MFSYIVKGLIIGILVSAPVGPIGILCIQRTLTRGKWHGIFTGLGATASDLFYVILAGLGIGFITPFIDAHRFVIQMIASVVVLAFGFYIYRSNPTRRIGNEGDKEKKSSYVGDALSSFALCISNPLILFLYIGIFAQVSFFSSSSTFFQIVIGILALLCGAFLWWLFLNSLVAIFRKRINIRGLVVVNKCTGLIIMAISLVTFVYSFFQ